MLSLVLAFALQAATDTSRTPDSAATAPLAVPGAFSSHSAADDTVRRRRRSIEYSDAYANRLRIHRIGSYTMLPLFAAEYALGQNLMNGDSPSWVKPTHLGVALGIGGLFVINTATGALNLWESREDPAGRTRRIVHSVLMIAADA